MSGPEYTIFLHEIRRLQDDYHRCEVTKIRQCILEDIMLLQESLEELGKRSNSDLKPV